jgi:hypothetical protein
VTEDQPDPREFVWRIKREHALRLMAIRQARLNPLALSASDHERMVDGWAAASGKKRINFICTNRPVW